MSISVTIRLILSVFTISSVTSSYSSDSGLAWTQENKTCEGAIQYLEPYEGTPTDIQYFQIATQADQQYLVSVNQLGTDVELIDVSAGLSVNSPFDGYGPEYLAFTAAGSTHCLALKLLEPGGTAQLRVKNLDRSDPWIYAFHRKLNEILNLPNRQFDQKTLVLDHLRELRDELDKHAASSELKRYLLAVVANQEEGTGFLDDALQTVDRSLVFDASDPLFMQRIYIMKAAIHNYRGAISQARRAVCQALQHQGLETDCLDLPPILQSQVPIITTQALNWVGLTFHILGDLQRARKWYQASATANAGRSPRHLAVTKLNIGGIFYELGNYSQAVEHLKKSADLSLSIGRTHNASGALSNLGTTYEYLGKIDSAIKAHNHALQLSIDDDRQSSHIQSLLRLSWLYQSIGRIEDALGYAQAAEKKLNIPSNRLKASVHRTLGGIQFLQEQYADARINIEKAYALIRDSENAMVITNTQNRLAKIYLMLNELDLAKQTATDSLNISKANGYGASANQSLLLLGQITRKQKEYVTSERHLRTALVSQTFSENLARKLEVHLELAYLAKDKNRTGEALDHVNDAKQIAEQIRGSIPRPDNRAYFSRTLRKLLALEIDLHLRSGALELALDRLLNNQGRTLMEGIALGTEGDPQFELRQKLANRAHALHVSKKDADSLVVREIRQDIRRLKLQLETIDANQPATDVAKLATQQIQQMLNDDQVYLHYFLTPDSSHLFWLDKNSIKHFDLPGEKVITEKITNYMVAVQSRGDLSEAKRQLNQTLLPNTIKQSQIYVVSDGAIAHVPFAALGENETLGNTHQFIYLPSAQLLKHKFIPRQNSAPRIAIVADPIFGNNDFRSPKLTTPFEEPFSRLPFTSLEAKAIAKSFANPETQVNTYLGFAANKMLFNDDNLSQYDILHLATHGFTETNLPEASGLQFSAIDESGAPTNGLLTLLDIYSKKFPQRLIVLSACDTALGANNPGEGTLSLARAFLRQGSQQVLASLWQVSDRATVDLMANFYQAWLHEGLSTSAALQKAQMQVMTNPKTRHPYYWAAFSIIGPNP